MSAITFVKESFGNTSSPTYPCKFNEHPWLGIGMDTVKVRWRELGIRAYEQFPLQSHFHSTPIQLGVERGLFGLGAWLCLMGVYLFLLVRLLRRYRAEDWPIYGVLLGIFGGLCRFLLRWGGPVSGALLSLSHQHVG